MEKFPPVLRIEPAGSCNLRCRHCPTGLGAGSSGLMTWETFEKVLTDVERWSSHLNVVVFYHGGEPLLNPRLSEMIAAVRNVGVGRAKVVTNGKLLDAKRIEQLLHSGLTELEVSLDSISPMASDSVRLRSRSSEVVDSIREVQKVIAAVGSGSTITVSTTQFIDDWYTNEEVNAMTSGVPTTPPVPDWLLDGFEGVDVKASWAIQWPLGWPGSQFVVASDDPPAPPSRCSLIDETLTVRWDGSVVICCYDLTSATDLGSIFDRSLGDLWQSNERHGLRQGFANRKYLPICETCAVTTGRRFLGRRALVEDSST